MLLIHSIFVVAFNLFFFTLLYVWIRYKIDVISNYGYRSGFRMPQVFDLEKGSISQMLQVFKRENDLMQYCFSDILTSARLLRGSHNLAFQVWVSTPPWCSSRW